MIDREYSTGYYKYLKISIGAVTKNLKTRRFVSDHLKTNKM